MTEASDCSTLVSSLSEWPTMGMASSDWSVVVMASSDWSVVGVVIASDWQWYSMESSDSSQLGSSSSGWPMLLMSSSWKVRVAPGSSASAFVSSLMDPPWRRCMRLVLPTCGGPIIITVVW